MCDAISRLPTWVCGAWAGQFRELFKFPAVIPVWRSVKSTRVKNEVRDALLVSVGLAIAMFALASFASSHF
jgi:hypothetical protein